MIKRNPDLQGGLDRLAKSLGVLPQSEAETMGVCPFCRETVGEFRDALCRREYEITGMCQACQDQHDALAAEMREGREAACRARDAALVERDEGF